MKKKELDSRQEDVKSIFITWLRKIFVGVEEKKPEASNNILQAYARGLRLGLQFGGRTCRYDFWGFVTVDILIISFLQVIEKFLLHNDDVILVYHLILMFPRIAILSRRLHDIDKKFIYWGLFLIIICFFLGYIVYLWIFFMVIMAQKGNSQNTVYGKHIIENMDDDKYVKMMIFFNVLMIIIFFSLCIYIPSFVFY